LLLRIVGGERPDTVGDVLLLARQFVGALLRVVDVALRAIAQRAFELLLRVLQAVERLLRLRGGAGVAAGGRAPHRVGRFLHLARGLEEILPVLFTGETLEAPRRFLGLVGERALAGAAARRG